MSDVVQQKPPWWRADWPYWLGGLAIALINIAILVVNNRPWGITSTVTYIGAAVLKTFGFTPQQWAYFLEEGRADILAGFSWLYGGIWLNLGIVGGVMLSGLAMGELRLRRIRSWRQVVLALAGGVAMGYGARLAAGCNAGALMGGIPSLSLHGWIFGIFTFIGAWVGVKLFFRYLAGE